MRSFDIQRPRQLDEALIALSNPAARAIAGGTGLVDLMKLGVEQPGILVDISQLPLRNIRISQGLLEIGALASNTAVAANKDVMDSAPAISEAILSGASGQIRNAATVGGNLAQATRCPYFRGSGWRCNRRIPGTGCAAFEHETASHAVLGRDPICIAVHPSDLAVALMALDATVVINGRAGARSLAIADFYRRPAENSVSVSSLGRDELVTAVGVPVNDISRTSTYLKLRHRASFEFASASVAAALKIREGRIEGATIALGGIATIPWRRRDLESSLIGQRPTTSLFTDFAEAIFKDAESTGAAAFKIPLARGAIPTVLNRLASR